MAALRSSSTAPLATPSAGAGGLRGACVAPRPPPVPRGRPVAADNGAVCHYVSVGSSVARGGAAKRSRCFATVVAAAGLDAPAYEEELKHACAAVAIASKLCQAVQQQLKESEQSDKDDASPVTVADYGAQCLVAWSLQNAVPGVPLRMIAEEDAEELRAPEGAVMRARITELVNTVLADEGHAPISEDQMMDFIDLGNSPGGAEGRHWVLDPIDGTRGFVGMRQYAVCLGMLDAGKAVLGVLGCPNLPSARVTAQDGEAGAAAGAGADDIGRMFAAVRGRGAKTGPISSELPTAPVTSDDMADCSKATFMESYESRHSDHTLSAAIAAELGITNPGIRMDSQVKYGCLARGDAQIFMRFPPSTYREKIWDHAAGVVILEEAGARISDASGADLDFSRGKWLDLDRGIVAATPEVHKRIISAIASVSAAKSDPLEAYCEDNPETDECRVYED